MMTSSVAQPAIATSLFARPHDLVRFYMDISMGGRGVAIPCRNAPAPGTELVLEVALPGQPRALRVPVRVVRTEGVPNSGARGGEKAVVTLAEPDGLPAQTLVKTAMRPRPQR